jgi:hypothetical protein
MVGWDSFKKYFNAWEGQTSKVAETVMRSPLVLEPAGSFLSAAMKTKAASDKLLAAAWGAVGLPTKRDQERTLHALNQIQSRLLDLEEKLAERDRDTTPRS